MYLLHCSAYHIGISRPYSCTAARFSPTPSRDRDCDQISATMTSTQATKRPKLADYDFVEEPSKEFYCPVTFELLQEPHQTLCCGNHLLQDAVTMLKGKSCPICKKTNFTTVPDKFFQRKINELKVRCPNKSLGCKWVGELGNLDRHLSQNSVEGECQFVTVACLYSCGDDLQRCQLEGHRANDCPNRPFTCQYCSHVSTYIEVTNEHLSVCKMYPIDCPNKRLGCQWIGQRGDLDQHLKGEGGCQYAEVACEFSYAGCRDKLPRRHMQAHLTENVKRHLSMVSEKISQQQCMIVRLQDTISKQQQMFEALVSSLSHMRDLVMTDFEERKRGNTSWRSPPFYSHIGGYKMCLKVYANGYGDGKGTHVSVFIFLMRGEYDDKLKWPFRADVSLLMLNQRRDEGHLEMTFSFDEHDDSDVDRVVGRKVSTYGIGFEELIPHAQLIIRNREYLKYDCLKFRIAKIIAKN